MTLLIAERNGDVVWMVADTAITGGNIAIRDRKYLAKIIPGQGSSLIGFSGDAHDGRNLVERASRLEPGPATLAFLLEGQRSSPSVDIAYGYSTPSEAHLFLVSDGTASERSTLHLGDTFAFEEFQRIRHRTAIDHAPEALHQFLMGAVGDDEVPDRLSDATMAMLHLFSAREQHDVGGWATPYFLTGEAVRLCGYAYSVSDPIVNVLRTGDTIPHGTAHAGGYSLSFCEIFDSQEAVVYWLQRPGGRIYSNSADGYVEHYFPGDPDTFKRAVREFLDRDAHIWFGGPEIDKPDRIEILVDELGHPRISVAHKGHVFSFGWIQGPRDSFRIGGRVNMSAEGTNSEEPHNRDKAFRVEPDSSSTGATLEFNTNGQSTLVHISTSQLDELMRSLAAARSVLQPEVPGELRNVSIQAIVDPKWQTLGSPHPSVPGALLSLRHPGHGWVGFVIPPHEERALGEWLVRDAQRQQTLLPDS